MGKCDEVGHCSWSEEQGGQLRYSSFKHLLIAAAEQTYGCIIAHCMGLGKTFTVISFVVTLLTNPTIRKIKDPYHTDSADVSALNQDSQRESQAVADDKSSSDSLSGNEKRLLHRILVVAPRNVVENWEKEFRKWTPHELLGPSSMVNITTIVSGKERIELKIKHWFEDGGILIMSYDQFRLLVDEERNNKKGQASADKTVMMRKYLQNPGPDLIIADEAHLIKNSKSKINEAMTMIHTRRRIALTGTPVQNHLEEYWCMVEWVKKRFLYSMKEYKRLFMDPIKKGEAKNAFPEDIKTMKKRSHALHNKLTPIVHRKDASELTKFLNKREFILTVRMSDFQRFLYKLFLAKLQEKGKFMLFRAYQSLMRVWNHPLATVIQSNEEDYKTKGGQLEKARALSSEMKHKLCSFDFLGKQVQGTYNYFQVHGKSTMQRLERRADLTEANLLKDNASSSKKTLTSSSSKKLRKRKRKKHADDDSDDDDEEEIGSVDSNDVEDDDYGSDRDVDEDNDDEEGTDDMDGFVVNDDYVEFDDDHSGSEDEHGIKKTRSATKSVKKRKRLRKSDEQKDIASSSAEKRRRSSLDSDDSGSDVGYFKEDKAEQVSDSQRDKKDNKLAKKHSKSSSNDAKKVKKAKSPDRMDTDDDDEDYVESDEEDAEDEHTETTAMTTSKSMDTLNTEEIREAIDANEEGNDSSDEMDVDDDDMTEQKLSSSAAATAAAAVKTVSPADHSFPTNIASAVAASSSASKVGPPIINDADITKAEDLTNEDEDPDEISSFWWKLNDPSLSTAAREEFTTLKPKDLLRMSHKMFTALALLALCVEKQEKVLIFSQSLYALNLIEMFIMQHRWGAMVGVADEDMSRYSRWSPGYDFLRIDGSVQKRQELIDQFNDSKRKGIKLMLISTKAGNMGINLQAANRVIIFDCSWNPVHDVQAIFRSFRVGQTKDVFVYRLVAAGSMEEKIYKRQVTKQQTAARVVDAQMPNNQFTDQERMALMEFNDESEIIDETVFEVVNSGTKDHVLSRFLETFGTQFFTSIENHDSYLEDVKEAHLDEEEKKNAEEELLLEINRMRNPPPRMTSVPATLNANIPPVNEDFHIAIIREFYRSDYDFSRTAQVINNSYDTNRTSAYCMERYAYLFREGVIERMKLNPQWNVITAGFHQQQQQVQQRQQPQTGAQQQAAIAAALQRERLAAAQREYQQRLQQREAQARN